ncbi:MAG TPA: hypothetical protein VFH78_14145 [Candidatus Thermoplasmatota archaeon]|nr:hypothetical protein [Candidatus Thermoplasmatota archaeon]
MRVVSVFLVLALLGVPLASAGGGADATAAKDPRNFTWVEEGVLAVGGGGLVEADVDWLAANGFGAIADFRAEHKDPQAYIESKGIAFLDMPIESAGDLSEAQFAAFVEWALAQKAAGRKIYIHCTNGWHRAAAFAVAYELATEKRPYDELATEAMKRRPGTVMRAQAGLLDYEASLTGKPQLAVVLVSPLSHPGLGGTMPAHVDVYANGAPVAGANVRVWSEESKLRIEGVTDANGRFTFQYVAPQNAFMDHIYARASLAGFADGGDNLDFIFQHAAKQRGALDVKAERTSDGLRVVATSNGKPLPIRVVANAPGWSEFESSDRGEAIIRHAPSSEISVRVVSWGSEGGVATVPASAVAYEPPAPATTQRPLRGEIEAERITSIAATEKPQVQPGLAPDDPANVNGRELAVRYATAALAGAALLALYVVVVSRSRAGVGRR